MNNKLFVGNLSFKLSDRDLQDLFAQYGTVVSCSVPTDRDTGRKRGFAFVEWQAKLKQKQQSKASTAKMSKVARLQSACPNQSRKAAEAAADAAGN